MTVLPRNAKVEEFRLASKDGRLVEAPKQAVSHANPLLDFMNKQKTEPFSRVKFTNEVGWGKSKACDWLTLAAEDGLVKKEGPRTAIVYRFVFGWGCDGWEEKLKARGVL